VPKKAIRRFQPLAKAGCNAVLRVFAPAKINLALHVTGQRSDGYHLLDTVVGFADVGDWVTVMRGATGVRVQGPEAAALSGENIISRVLTQFGAKDVAVVLDKHLPIASGIGGGSSDAAAAYRGLCAMPEGRALLGRGARAADMAQLLAIGADVPMCAAAQPALVRGIGEQITPLPNLARLHAVLVNPRVHVPTPQIFKALARKDNPALPPLPHSMADGAALTAWLGAQRNDLQPPAIVAAPVIADVLAAIAGAGAALARMSGSGATCFGLYPSAADAARAAGQIIQSQPNWWVVACQINGSVDISPQAIRATT
jgi:4-diphosphocytidyl-2-C-methyl-D-erythritol kinase